MEINKKELIDNLLKNPRIFQRAKELKLNYQQLEEALPILIDMDNENINGNAIYLTSFFLTPNGIVKRNEILSKKGQKIIFKKNIISQDLYKIEFNEKEKYFKNNERGDLITKTTEFFNELKKQKKVKGFYIYGPMGVGKTFTMKRIAKKLAQENYKVGFINLPALVSKIKASFNTEERYDEIIQILVKAEFLFIDDIGAESISSWFRDEFLFGILNIRMEKNKTTFFTSNYSLKELENKEAMTFNMKYKDFDKSKRLINRIQTLSIPILLNGKNIR